MNPRRQSPVAAYRFVAKLTASQHELLRLEDLLGMLVQPGDGLARRQLGLVDDLAAILSAARPGSAGCLRGCLPARRLDWRRQIGLESRECIKIS
jgi:hypothetical protein